MPMPIAQKDKTLAARNAVDAYRASHTVLYAGGYFKGADKIGFS